MLGCGGAQVYSMITTGLLEMEELLPVVLVVQLPAGLQTLSQKTKMSTGESIKRAVTGDRLAEPPVIRQGARCPAVRPDGVTVTPCRAVSEA